MTKGDSGESGARLRRGDNERARWNSRQQKTSAVRCVRGFKERNLNGGAVDS